MLNGLFVKWFVEVSEQQPRGEYAGAYRQYRDGPYVKSFLENRFGPIQEGDSQSHHKPGTNRYQQLRANKNRGACDRP